MTSFLRITEHRSQVYRTVWRSSLANSILTPAVFLAAMGLGVGSYVDGNGSSALGAVEYIVYLAPGLLAANAMNVAFAEGTFPIFSSVHWDKTAYAQVSTPMSPSNIALGQIAWAALRILVVSTMFLGVMLIFDATTSPWVILAVPAAVLVGLAFMTPFAAWSIGLERMNAFPTVGRFVITPMFLFSGVFFPVSQLPDAIEPIAYITPLWHGVRLSRSLALGEDIATLANLGHVAVLASMAGLGIFFMLRNYKKKLLL